MPRGARQVERLAPQSEIERLLAASLMMAQAAANLPLSLLLILAAWLERRLAKA